MEKSGSKCTLLPSNELELSIDGATRRKRKLCHCIFIANVLLCLISCIAAITCIVNYNLTLGEIERARSGLDERYNEILTAVHDEKPETIAENFEIDTEETDGEETEILVDLDTSVEIPETISSIENPPTETDEYYFDDAEEYISSGDDRNGDESEIISRDRRSLSDEGNIKRERRKKTKKQGTGKPCKKNDKGCRKGRKNRNFFSPLAAQYDASVQDTFITEKLQLFDTVENTAVDASIRILIEEFISFLMGWLGGAKVSCILRHRGVQLILAYSWARPAILVADGCSYVSEMRGDLCRSKVFTPEDHTVPLNIFHPTSWVEGKKSPLKYTDGSSSFQVKTSGILLVFAQVSFSTDRPTNGVSIVQSRESQYPVQELQCKQGIQQGYTTKGNVSQSCSVVGLLRVMKGDYLEIYSNYKYSGLDLNHGSTYFGAVQLTKG